jgi:hypothetical protein
MQILVVLPSVELLCFADVADGSSASMAGSSQGHRWVVTVQHVKVTPNCSRLHATEWPEVCNSSR